MHGVVAFYKQLTKKLWFVLRENLISNLVGGAENVGIVLLEPAHPRQTRESSREFITMKNAKVGHSQGKFSPGTRPVVKHHAR